MNRRVTTVFNRCPDVRQVASRLARKPSQAGGGTMCGAGMGPGIVNRRPLVQAIGAALMLLGSTSVIPAHADTIVSAGDTSSQIRVDINVLTNVQIDSGGTVSDIIAIQVFQGTIGTLNNAGGIIGTSGTGVRNTGGTIGQLTNSGRITGSAYGLENLGFGTFGSETGGQIDTLTNQGSIGGGVYGIINTASGTIGVLDNSGTITASVNAAIRNDRQITTLINSGVITGNTIGVYNWGAGATIGSLSNSGAISGGQQGIYNNSIAGTVSLIGALSNSGRITSSTGDGIGNNGGLATITRIDNAAGGTITGPAHAIFNNGGMIGTLANAGLIAGDIGNNSANPLTITGATAAGSFGTLTGYDTGTNAVGTITSTQADLKFAGGNILLNDNIDVGSQRVVNAGNLAVSNLMTITGNYMQTASGTLTSNVSSGAGVNGNFSGDSGYGRLRVTGSATLQSGAAVVLASTGYAFANGQRFVVVEGNAASSFDTVNGRFSAGGFQGTVTAAQQTDGSNQALVLTLSPAQSPTPPDTGTDTPAAAPHAPTTPVAVAVLGGLQHYRGTQAGLLDLYDASLAISSTAEANHVGAQLAPTQNFSAGSATSEATFDALNVVGAHVDALRVDAAHSGLAGGDNGADWAAWGQFYGGHAQQSMRDEVSGYAATSGGLVLGADRSLTPRWRAGGAFAYSNTAVYGADELDGDASHINSYGLIAYAGYTGEPWYLNLSASAHLQKYTTSRLIALTGFSGQAEGRFNGRQYVARAEFGYPLALPGSVTVAPIAALSYSNQQQSGYTESGGNGAALSVDNTHVDALRSSLGAKLERSLKTDHGELLPFVQLMWSHQYNQGRGATSANFAADTAGETDFMIVGASPVRDTAELRLGADLIRSDSMRFALRYDLQTASGYLSQALSLRLRKQF